MFQRCDTMNDVICSCSPVAVAALSRHSAGDRSAKVGHERKARLWPVNCISNHLRNKILLA